MEEKLVQTVAQAPRIVALVCPVKPVPELTPAPVEVVVRHRRCLAALSVSELLAMTQPKAREIWLDDNACATCPLAAAQQTLHTSVAAAQTLLQAVDATARLELCSDHPELDAVKPVTRPLLDGMQPKIARRRFFGFAKRVAQSPPQIDGVPLSHQRLVEQIRCMSSGDEAQLAATLVPFAEVQIDEHACSACALCAHFCPTAALQFEVAEQEFAIRFRADRCIGCTLCRVACPDDAIQVAGTISLDKLFFQHEQALVTGELAPCVQCGAVTAVCDGEPLCHACRHGAGRVTSLRDGAGLMADLLSRIAPL
jgi:ferredoxin